MRIKWVGEGGKCWGDIDDDVPPEVRAHIDTNAKDIANAVEARAKASTDFKDETGYLRSYISAKKSKFPDGGYIVGAWAPHAWVVEFGHELIDWRTGKKIGDVSGKSYLRRALNAEVSWAIVKFKVGVK